MRRWDHVAIVEGEPSDGLACADVIGSHARINGQRNLLPASKGAVAVVAKPGEPLEARSYANGTRWLNLTTCRRTGSAPAGGAYPALSESCGVASRYPCRRVAWCGPQAAAAARCPTRSVLTRSQRAWRPRAPPAGTIRYMASVRAGQSPHQGQGQPFERVTIDMSTLANLRKTTDGGPGQHLLT